MTAVKGDLNSLFFNPAGLAFVGEGHFDVSATAGAGLSRGFLAVNPLVYIEQQYDSTYSPTQTYWYALPNTPDGSLPEASSWAEMVSILEANGLGPAEKQQIADDANAASWGSLKDYDQYNAYKDRYYRMQAYKQTSDTRLELSPRVWVGGPGWGAVLVVQLKYVPAISTFTGGSSVVSYQVAKQLGAVAGLGLNLGPLAVGATLKALNRSTFDTKTTTLSQMNGPPLQVLAGSLGDAFSVQGRYDLGVGVGALASLGPLNVGLSVSNLLPFLDSSQAGTPFLDALMAGTDFGVSVMPYEANDSGFQLPIRLVGAVDLHGLGSDTQRDLAAGAELGIDAWGFFQAVVRGGYRQPLPGPLATLASQFDPQKGQLYAGATAKLLFLKVEVAGTLPVVSLGSLPGSGSRQTDLHDPVLLGGAQATITLAF